MERPRRVEADGTGEIRNDEVVAGLCEGGVRGSHRDGHKCCGALLIHDDRGSIVFALRNEMRAQPQRRRGRDGAERRRDERCAERKRAVGGRAEIERRAASAPGRRGAHAGGENLEIACEQLTLRQRNVGTRHGGRRTDQQAHCELVAVRQ